MVLGLDLMFLAPGRTGGMETYARGLVPELAAHRPDTRFVAFCGRELAAELRSRPWLPGLRIVELPVSSDTRVRRTAVEQALLPAAVRRSGVDLLHSLGNTAPLVPGGPPLVVTVHDVIWARHPETHAGVLAHGLGVLVRGAVRRARRVIVPSHATARDLVELLGADPERIDVVVEGPGLPTGVEATPESELRARFGIPDGPVVLCPASPRPHKNVRRLVEATRGLGATLVVPGYENTREEGLREAHVRLVGWLSQGDLEGMYAAATLMALPSLAEGFGLPVLEAMLRGLPVACSRTGSLPEVAGDAALLFDPVDVGDIRSAVDRLLGDPGLRATLAARARERAGGFSWSQAAMGTWRTYDRVLAKT